MNILKNAFNYLNGKKTVIGVAIHFVAYGAQGIKLIDDSTFRILIVAGDYVMAFGLGHKTLKFLVR